MEKKYTTPYGILECFRGYVIFYLKTVNITTSLSEYIVDLINAHYKGEKYVFISEREFASKVDPKAYKFLNDKLMVGLAIVSNKDEVKNDAYKEMDLYQGSFGYFQNVTEAVDWAKTLIRIEEPS